VHVDEERAAERARRADEDGVTGMDSHLTKATLHAVPAVDGDDSRTSSGAYLFEGHDE